MLALLALVLSLILYLWLAARHIELPGPYYDEVYHVPAALHLWKGKIETDFGGSWLVVTRWRVFPLMLMPYLGAPKSYLLGAIFAASGSGIVSHRMTGILLVLIGMIFAARWVWGMYGAWAAATATSIAATDPVLILFTRTDLGPLTGAFALRCAALYLLWRWWGDSRTWRLIAACGLMGLGVWDKANFFWFVAAYAVIGAAAWRAGGRRPHLSPAQCVAALAAFLAASAPFWLFNLLHGWGTVGVLSSEGGFSIERLAREAPERTAMLREVLAGDTLNSWMFGEPKGAPGRALGTLLGPATAVAAIALSITGWRRPQRLIPIVVLGAIIAQIYLMPIRIAIWHWAAIHPFPAVAIGVAAGAAWQSSRSSRRARAAALIVGSACLLILFFNLATMIGYHRIMVENRGSSAFSTEIYALAETLSRDYAGREIEIMDWGFNTQLALLSGGALRTRERFWKYTGASEPGDDLLALVSRPENVFLLHAGDAIIFPSAEQALHTAASRACVEARELRRFTDWRRLPVYVLLDFTPRPCAEKPAAPTW
jgi:hypothetical protein